MSIGWIIFWKCIVLAIWGTFQDWREKQRDTLRAKLFYEEWRRRSAKHALPAPKPLPQRPE